MINRSVWCFGTLEIPIDWTEK